MNSEGKQTKMALKMEDLEPPKMDIFITLRVCIIAS